MYRITITRENNLTEEEKSTRPVPSLFTTVYEQSFDELNVAATIALLNKQPRTRGPRTKKAVKP